MRTGLINLAHGGNTILRNLREELLCNTGAWRKALILPRLTLEMTINSG
jgi:hypothetical protein